MPPTPTVAGGSVAVVDIIYDPAQGNDGDGETVFIQNATGADIDMTGWTLSDIAEHVYVFPEYVLPAGGSVQINICNGQNTATHLYWGRCSAIWNNEGDTAFLHDATGREISQFSY